MAYDKEKAHEYYVKYRKKGIKKGRKKGKSKTSTKKTNLVGLSTGGLNDQGKMQWAMAKEKLKTDMNAALAKAKTPEEKEKIRQEYQKKALSELQKMKSDPSMAKAKATKAASSKSAKSSKGSSSKGSSKSSGGSTKSSSGSSSSSSSTQSAELTKAVQQAKDLISELQKKLLGDDEEGMQSEIAKLSVEQKAQVRTQIQNTIDTIRKKLSKT